MGKFSRSKGSRGEREIIAMMQPVIDTAYLQAGKEPPRLKRTSSTQADGGGCDVCGLDWLALEVKRCEVLQLNGWWQQCVQQARPGQVPVLCYRQNSKPWLFRTYIYAVIGDSYRTLVANLSWEDFRTYNSCMFSFH